MTTLKDIINDFGQDVIQIGRDNESEVENLDRYEELLDECMESVKKLIGAD